MMLATLKVAARDRARLAEVTGVVSRYGLDVVAARLGLGGRDDGADAFDLPRRTREAMEALGPVWVKLGQILATRADLLAPAWIAEFERLQSSAPRLPFDDLRPAVEEALGEPPEAAFARFEVEPLAAASMAQVHRAALADGTEVAVKIRRPGIRETIEADLRLIAQLAAVAESANAEARRYGATAMARELARHMRDELDFTVEGENTDLLARDFAADPRVVVPRVHWRSTSETVLVTDFVDGVPPRDAGTLRAAGIDPDRIAEAGADVVLAMVFANGRFHGDPHPGNLLCLPGDRIGLIDMGLVGQVSPRRRGELIAFARALTSGDAGLLADTFARWSTTGDVPPDRLRDVAEAVVARHGGGPILLGAIVADTLPLLRDERMVLPPDLLLIFKALVTVDGVLAAIAPDHDLAPALKRAARRIAAERLRPERWSARAMALAAELDRVGDDLPRLIRLLAARLEASPPAAESLTPAIEKAGRWIAAAVVLAGALIAAARMLGG